MNSSNEGLANVIQVHPGLAVTNHAGHRPFVNDAPSSPNGLALSPRARIATGCVLAGLLFWGLRAFGAEMIPVPTNILVRSCGNPSSTLSWAVDRILAELLTIHQKQARSELATSDPFTLPADNAGVLVLGRLGESPALSRWCREQGADWAALASNSDGYRIVTQARPFRVVITANTDLGLWYGACAWLDALRDTADGTVVVPGGEFGGAPALAFRFARGLMPGRQPSRMAEAIPWLDWWARWRLNVTVVGESSEAFLRQLLPEAHKRGIRVLRSLGVRNVCAADDDTVARCAAELKRFMDLGGDGVSALWDDLPHERCRGHCDRCRERFGTNGLPQEIVRVLEALCDAAAGSSRPPLIVWCPSHYSEDRYPELSDESFFRAMGASRKVRQQTHMYYCEFDPARTALLDRVGITNRVWWYNGLRTVYHVCHRWPTAPGVKLSIPGVESLDVPDFPRFEVGWKTGLGVRADGSLIAVPDRTWQGLRSLPTRFRGYYPCTPAHPYHAAISGLFAFDPHAFDQAEADRMVFRPMFGPGSAQPARAWSDAYMHYQVCLAQTDKTPSGASPRTELRERLVAWRSVSREVTDCAARGRSLLAPPLLDSVLARMREAEDAVERILESAPSERTRAGLTR